jgi:hypothetical protein
MLRVQLAIAATLLPKRIWRSITTSLVSAYQHFFLADVAYFLVIELSIVTKEPLPRRNGRKDAILRRIC